MCGTIAQVQVPASGPPSTLLAIRFTKLRWWRREFRSSLLDRCTMLFDRSNLVFITVSSECTSAAVYVFGGARTLVCRICTAALMSQESSMSSCPPSVLCSAAGCACHHRARQPHRTTNRARAYARALSTRLFLPVSCACPPTQCSTFASSQASVLRHPHVHCLRGPAQAAWDPTRPTKLQQPQPGGTLNHVAESIGDGGTAS